MDSSKQAKSVPSRSSGRWWFFGATGILVLSAWILLGSGLRLAVGKMGPWVAGLAGYDVKIGSVQGSLWQAVEAQEVTVKTATGTNLQIGAAKFYLTKTRHDGSVVPRWGLQLAGLQGKIVRVAAPDTGRNIQAPLSVILGASGRWASEIELAAETLLLEDEGGELQLRDLRARFGEGESGHLEVGEAILKIGDWKKFWSGLKARTSWREGTVSLSDLSLAEDVMVDNFSWNFGAPATALLEARLFGGSIQADWQGPVNHASKAAVNVYQVDLQPAARFLGVKDSVKGLLKVVKLTFNGDPKLPLSAQISSRVEAEGFAWGERAFDELTLGVSAAGRRLRINEGLLQQKGNAVNMRGTLFLPPDAAAWRSAPFEFDVSATVGDLSRLHALLGWPRGEWSGALQVDGSAAGKLGDGAGWLRVRGWDLRAQGIPATSLQADLRLDGARLDFLSGEAQSGPNNARARGHLNLGPSLTYQGRLELRVRDVSRYLELLGRRAPDWAREGDVKLLWEGDGSQGSHSGVADFELSRFTGDLNPVPVNARLQATYAPGNVYVSRLMLDRGPLELTTSLHFGEKGLMVKDVELFNARTRLLWGEIFLPLSLAAVLERRPWEETFMEDREFFSSLRSDNMDLGALVQLFGQQTTLQGKVDMSLDAKGPWRTAQIDGELTVVGLAAKFPSFQIPESRLTLKLAVKDRLGNVDSSWQPDGAKPLDWRARVPLIGEGPEDTWTLVDKSRPCELDASFSDLDLAVIRPAFGRAVMDQGRLSGELQFRGTPDQPEIQGELQWQGGRLTLPPGWSPLSELETKMVFRGEEVVLEETRGKVGSGSIGVAGKVNFADRANLEWEILLRGENAGFYEDENFRLVGRGDLEARGNNQVGTVRGSLDLSGSMVRRGLELTPSLAEEKAEAILPPAGLKMSPFASWSWDINVSTVDALPVGKDGAVRPELAFSGTLGAPLIVGTVHVDRAQVRLPSRSTVSAAGKLHFTREKPWVPVMDVVGLAEANAYDIRAGVFGPLGQRNLYLSSTPEMSVEQIVTLLTTGVAPEPAGAAPREFIPEERMKSEPSWLDLAKIRGLLGWGEQAEVSPWGLGDQPVSYRWSWSQE